MSGTIYTGNPANGARAPAIQLTEPADLDALNAASVNALALSKLADYVAWLQAHAAIFDQVNSFSANQAFTAAAAQELLKTVAGGLIFGTAAGAGDLTLSANGVALLKLLATGSLDAQAKILGNLAAPVSAGDALRKEAVAWTNLTVDGTNWTAFSSPDQPAYWKDPAGIVHFKGKLTAVNTGTASMLVGGNLLPAGCRVSRSWVMPAWNQGAGAVWQFYASVGGGISPNANITAGQVLWLDGCHYPADA